MIIIENHLEVHITECYRDEPALSYICALDNFPGNSASLKFKQKITNSMRDNGTKNFKLIGSLNYFSIF